MPFDAARTLASPEAQAELLSDAMQSGDTGYIANALGVIARVQTSPGDGGVLVA
jgi:DNA-binding phage protein